MTARALQLLEVSSVPMCNRNLCLQYIQHTHAEVFLLKQDKYSTNIQTAIPLELADTFRIQPMEAEIKENQKWQEKFIDMNI